MRVKNVSVYTSETIVINFDDGLGWIVATFCEERGSVQIQSDWGNVAFVWLPRNTGFKGPHALKLFFAQAGLHYLLNKFSYNQSRLKDVIDAEATIKRLKERVCEWRRDGSYDKEKAREIWDDIELYADDLECFDGDVDMNRGYNRWYDNMSEHFDDALRPDGQGQGLPKESKSRWRA